MLQLRPKNKQHFSPTYNFDLRVFLLFSFSDDLGISDSVTSAPDCTVNVCVWPFVDIEPQWKKRQVCLQHYLTCLFIHFASSMPPPLHIGLSYCFPFCCSFFLFFSFCQRIAVCRLSWPVFFDCCSFVGLSL